MDTRTVGTFDLERYLRNSKKVDISDIDLSQASQYPLSEEETRCLTYMWMLKYMLQGSEGEKIAKRIDETIAKLPGLEWFDGLTANRAKSLENGEREKAPTGALAMPSR